MSYPVSQAQGCPIKNIGITDATFASVVAVAEGEDGAFRRTHFLV